MLIKNNTGLIIVDVQGKLAQSVANSEPMINAITQLVQGAKLLDLPVIWVEQLPDKLGATVAPVSALLQQYSPLAKATFSAWQCAEIQQQIQSTARKQWLVCGIETHICVFQTVRDLLANGYEVELVSDAVSSRTPENRAIGIQRMAALGAEITSVEMALFDLLQRADTAEFKAILPYIK